VTKDEKINLINKAVRKKLEGEIQSLQIPFKPLTFLDSNTIDIKTTYEIIDPSNTKLWKEFLVICSFEIFHDKPEESEEASSVENMDVKVEGDEVTIQENTTGVEDGKYIRYTKFSFMRVRFANEKFKEVFKSRKMQLVQIDMYGIYDDWNEPVTYFTREYQFYVDGEDESFDIIKDEIEVSKYFGNKESAEKNVESEHSRIPGKE